MELVLPKHRSLVGNVPFMVFLTAGLVSLPWIAYVVGNWQFVTFFMYSPLILVPFTHW